MKSVAANPAAVVTQVRPRFRAADHATLVRGLSVIATLAIWEWYGRGVDPIFFSYPTAIVAAVPQMLETGELQAAISSSITGFVVGFALAIVIGVGLGLLTGRYRTMDNILDAQISALYSTPNVALIPLLILWFGLGLQSKIAIIFLAAFFPIVVNTNSGVRNVSRGLIEVAQVERARESQIFTKIIVPAALPFIMTGVRLSVGRAIVGMVVAEMFTSINGLGGAIITYGNQFATAKLLVVIIILAVSGVLLTSFVRLFEGRLSTWKATERGS